MTLATGLRFGSERVHHGAMCPPKWSKMRDVRDRGRFIGALTVVTVLYFLAGTLGLSLAAVNASVTAVWPPAGIAVAALLVLGLRAWPAAAIGAFLTNLVESHEIVPSVAIAAGNTLEYLAAAMLATRFARGRFAFERGSDILRFTVVSALVAPIIAATVGTATLRLTGPASPVRCGDGLGHVVAGRRHQHRAVRADVRAVDRAPAALPDRASRSALRLPQASRQSCSSSSAHRPWRCATCRSRFSCCRSCCGRHFVSTRGRRRHWVSRCRSLRSTGPCISSVRFVGRAFHFAAHRAVARGHHLVADAVGRRRGQHAPSSRGGDCDC